MKPIVILTGGTDGIGLEIAKLLSADHTLFICARNETRLQQVIGVLNCEGMPCDISIPDQVQRMVDTVIEKYKRIDILINNAGIWTQNPLDKEPYNQIEYVMKVNTLGAMFVTRAVVSHMKTQQSGMILFMNSQAGLRAKKERSIYTASKFAITGFTKSLQEELSPFGIRVSGIYPGRVGTKMFEKAGIDKPVDGSINAYQIAKLVRTMIDLPHDTFLPELGITTVSNFS